MDCSPDIDWAELIRITDGYSGADLANVCRDAAMMPLRKKIASGGINIAQIS
jgi:katanin p60 ATPase-containing subunit A1